MCAEQRQSWPWVLRLLLQRGLAAWLVGSVVMLLAIGPSQAQAEDAVDAGDLVILDIDGTPLRNGGSATDFSLQMPSGAACPGDSMNDQWRVQSFIIPAADDIGAVEYGVVGPKGLAQRPLYELDTRRFVNQLTLPNLTTGQPGLIGGVPLMNFAPVSPGTFPPGRYRIGIACTLFKDNGPYWDTEIVIENSPDDSPAGFTWRLPEAPSYEAPRDSGSLRRWLGIGLLVIGGATVTWAVVSRSLSSFRRKTSKEST